MDKLVFLNSLSATAVLLQRIKMLKQQLAAALERETMLQFAATYERARRKRERNQVADPNPS